MQQVGRYSLSLSLSPTDGMEGEASRLPRARSRRRRHATMVTPTDFREIVAARAEGRALAFGRSARAEQAEQRRVSVLLADDELGALQESKSARLGLCSPF